MYSNILDPTIFTVPQNCLDRVSTDLFRLTCNLVGLDLTPRDFVTSPIASILWFGEGVLEALDRVVVLLLLIRCSLLTLLSRESSLSSSTLILIFFSSGDK